MDKKFMTVKRIVVPILTVLIMLAQLAPSFAVSQKDIVAMMHDTPTVTIEVYSDAIMPSSDVSDIITLSDENTLALSGPSEQGLITDSNTRILASANVTTQQLQPPEYIKGYLNTQGMYPTSMLTNFPEMRQTVEEIFDTTTVFGQKSGRLYTAGNNTGLAEFLYTDKNINVAGYTTNYQLLKSPAVQAKLREAASKSFPDVRGVEWYADKLAIMTYYGIVSGVPDGNSVKFAPNDLVTRAEFVTMLGRAQYQLGSGYTLAGRWTEATGQPENWYSLYAMRYNSDSFLNFGNGLTTTSIKKAMTRFECMYIFDQALLQPIGYNTKGEASKYFKDVKNRGDMIQELKLYIPRSDISFELKPNWGLSMYDAMLKDPTKGVYNRVYDALARGYETKMMIGTPDGLSNWNLNVTRAEAMQMVYNFMVYGGALEGDFMANNEY